MYRVYRGEKAGLRAFPWYAAALILAFMLGLKFHSPQYVIWPLPLVPLGVGGVSDLSRWAVFLAACSLTAQVFPVHHDDLLGLRPPAPSCFSPATRSSAGPCFSSCPATPL